MRSGAVHQGDPSLFCTDEHEIDEWLSQYKGVSAPNRYHDIIEVCDDCIYLHKLVKFWFRNNKAYHDHQVCIVKVFRLVQHRQHLPPHQNTELWAEQRLRAQAQRAGETSTRYINDAVNFCQRIDAALVEADKIAHRMKGIDDDGFQMLLAKDPRKISDIITQFQSYDEVRRMRALTRDSSVHGEPLLSLTAAGENSSLMRQLQQFVRDEVALQESQSTGRLDDQRQRLPLVHLVVQSSPEAYQGDPYNYLAEKVAEALSRTPQYAPLN